jgi:peptidoglycan/LPS O-acetylase OafA/YrhL
MCGLETLRGLAALLVVLLHAGIPYMTQPLQHLVWPARSASPSVTVNAIVWCAECLLMPLFFVLGGFFAKGLLVTRGDRQFLIERTWRLAPTQVVAALVVLPICLVIWCVGWVADGLYVPQDIFNTGLPAELNAELWGVAHIWFLQNLYIYCLILYGATVLSRRWRTSSASDPSQTGLFDRALMSFWKPLIPVVPCALVLYWDPRIVIGFYQCFLPVFSKLVYYAIYFFIGARMYQHGSTLTKYARYGRTYLAAAALLFCVMLPLIHEHLATPLTGGKLALLTGMLSLFAWLATFGLLAEFLTHQYDGPALRYLAEASFWLYLVHLPFVVLTQIAIAPLALPTEVKYVLAGAIPVALAMMSYAVFVRNTRIGWFLNGCRQDKTAARVEPTAAPALTVTLGNAAQSTLAPLPEQQAV